MLKHLKASKLKQFNNVKEVFPKENKFNYKDPFLIEQQYTSEEVLIRNTAKSFARNELLPKRDINSKV